VERQGEGKITETVGMDTRIERMGR